MSSEIDAPQRRPHKQNGPRRAVFLWVDIAGFAPTQYRPDTDVIPTCRSVGLRGGGCLSYGVSMPTSRSSSHPFGNSASKPLSRRVWERFLMKWALHLRQNHPSPENIQYSSSTQSCASSLLSHHPPFSEQSSATRVWHTTEY